jgi:hypothetical protein
MTAGATSGVIADTDDASGDNLEVPTGGGGDYEIHYSISAQAAASDKNLEACIMKNGSEVAGAPSMGWVDNQAGYLQYNGHAILPLAAGDEIKIGIANTIDTTNIFFFAASLTINRISY